MWVPAKSYNIIPKMSSFQLKITSHTKNQEDLKLSEKSPSVDAKNEMRAAGIIWWKCFYEQLWNAWNNVKIGSLSKEIKDIKKNHMEILELKNIITKLKNSVNGVNSRIEKTEEIVHKLENRRIETSKAEQWNENIF